MYNGKVFSYYFDKLSKVHRNSQFLSVSQAAVNKLPKLHCHCRMMSVKSETPSVYITRKPPDDIIKQLEKASIVVSFNNSEDKPISTDQLNKEIAGKSALLCLLTDTVSKETIQKAGASLKVVSTMSVGYDHVDIKALKEAKIRLGFTPNILTDATAELTIGLLLATTRRLSEGISAARNGQWAVWKPFWMCGRGLVGSTVGIVGLGRIGMAVAERCVPFGVQRIVFSRSPSRPISTTPLMTSSGFKMEHVQFENLLQESDFVIICCALTEQTANLFNEKTFSMMKPTSVLVNTSRGGVVDQEALREALQSGVIWAAGLDVTTPEPLPPSHPLFQLDNCVILPHIGSANLATRCAMWQMAADNVIAGVKGESMPAEVSL